MHSINIEVTDSRIRVRAPFDYKDTLKSVTGARWQPKTDSAAGAWTYPASASSAQAVFSLFSRNRAAEVVMDSEFARLLKVAENMTHAQDKKSAQALPEIPCSKTRAWLHQKQAFHFVGPMPAALLWMGMGTGKTKVVCDLIVNRNHKRVLVVCPKKVIKTWEEENEIHSGRDVQVVLLQDGDTQQKVLRAQMAIALADAANVPVVVVINYESAYREPFGPTYTLEEYRDSRSGEMRTRQVMKDKGFALTAGFDLVIMDEGHKIKKPGGRISKFCAHFPQHIANRLELTGTPMAHGPQDIYAQFRALDPGIFGTSFAKFRERYLIMGGFQNREVIGFQNMDEFDAKMASITYHVGEEVLDLPPVRHRTLYCQLSERERKAYNEMDAAMCAGLDGEAGAVADNILVKMLRCQQITSGVILDEDERLHELGSSKRDLLADTLEDLSKEDLPVVVYCKFIQDLDNVHRVAKEMGLESGEISGRADDLAEFKAGRFDIIAVQIQAGGAGVNLTRSHVAIYYSVGYSLLDYLQSLKRLDRPGQTKSVLNVYLIAEGTIDEDVYAALSNKEEVSESVKRRIKERQKVQKEAA